MTATLIGLVATLNVAADEAPVPPVVVELFTSQGCSSCPPAETLLGELSHRKDVLPLAFHVTYWNSLGWRDLFSFPGADARQSRYAGSMGRSGVYTPQMVINGVRDIVGSQRTDVLKAIAAAKPPAAVRLVVSAGTLRIQLPDIGGCDCELLLLGVLPSAQSAIGRGENAGRLLQEYSVVRRTSDLQRWDGKALVLLQPVLPWPADASRLVLLAQHRQSRQIVAAGVTQ